MGTGFEFGVKGLVIRVEGVSKAAIRTRTLGYPKKPELLKLDTALDLGTATETPRPHG